MTSYSSNYSLRNIRALLTEGFTDSELRRLCYDSQGFRSVYDQMAQNTGKAEVIDRLLAYAEQTMQIETLLAWIKDRNPAKYEQLQPYISSTEAISASEDTGEVTPTKDKALSEPELTSVWLLPGQLSDVDELVTKFKLGKEQAQRIVAQEGKESPVSILSDLPASEDSLGFQHLVLTLANIILAETTETPITIGIDGAWGSGKTSILKMLERKAKTLDFYCIWLNAWSLETLENLMATVAAEIQREFSDRYSEHQDQLPEKLNLPSTVTTRSSFQKLVQTLLSDSSYEYSRLIIFIDDIDRALPDQIVEILKNLKLILEVEQCVFVLAMDMNIVARSVENYYRGKSQQLSLISVGSSKVTAQGNIYFSQAGDQTEAIRPGFGYNYLEKIVQLMVEVPDLTRVHVYTYLKNMGITSETLEILHWAPDEDVLNPRRLKRYINWLNISLQLIISAPVPTAVRNVTALRAMALQRDYPEIYKHLLEEPEESSEAEFRSLILRSFVSRRNFTKQFEEEITEFQSYLRQLPWAELTEFDQYVRKTPMLNAMKREYRYAQVVNWDEPLEELQKSGVIKA